MGKSFILYTDQMMALSSVLSAEQLGRLMQLVLTYQATGQEPEAVDADLVVAWAMLKLNFQVNDSKYQETIEKRREAGKKSGEVRKQNSTKRTSVQFVEQNEQEATKRTSVQFVEQNEQEATKRTDNVNVNVNVINKKNNTLTCVSKKSTRKKFIKPTLEEVAAYCRERGNGIDPEHWLAHYEANGWKVGKAATPMADWKACIRTWEGNNFGTRATITNEDLTSINNTRYESNDY